MREIQTEVQITRMGREGDGVALIEGQAVYIPFTLPGDTAEIAITAPKARKKNTQSVNITNLSDLSDKITLSELVTHKYSKVKLLNVKQASPERQKAVCAHFGSCGGCALQNWQDAPYQAWKHNIVEQSLLQIGITSEEIKKYLNPLFSVSQASRRRIVLTANLAGGKVTLGFNRNQSHEIIAIEECPVAQPELVNALPFLRRLLKVLKPRHKNFHIILTHAENGLDIAFQGLPDIAESEKLKITDFITHEKQTHVRNAIAQQILRITSDEEIIFETIKPYLFFDKIRVEIPSGGFLQAVASAENFMADIAKQALQKSKKVVDLFSGCGSFTFRLANKSTIHAVEWDKQALKALNQGRTDAASLQASGDEQDIPKLKKITSERRDLFAQPLTYKELADFDGLIFDPPRAGAEAQALEIAKAQIKTVVAVSCNPVTFARDLNILLKAGYELQSITPIDQFLWSSHVEIVAVLKKKKPKKSWTL